MSDRSTSLIGERAAQWWREGRPLLSSRWTHTKDGMQLTWIGRAVNWYHSVTKWVRWSWWTYVLAEPEPGTAVAPYWTVVFCRMRGHDDIVYFNPGGMEPDTSCRRCGEELG